MYKYVFVFCVLIAAHLSSNTQDLILTTEGDSLHCKITRATDDYLYITYKADQSYHNTLIASSQVEAVHYNFDEQNPIPLQMVIGYEEYNAWELHLAGGIGHHTAKVSSSVSPDLKNYVNKMKTGFQFGGELIYNFGKRYGLGFKSQWFKSSNSMNNVYVTDINGARRYGNLSDDLTISYYALSFTSRLVNTDSPDMFYTNMSIGYVNYKNNKVIVDRYTFSGETLGLTLGLGYEKRLSKAYGLMFNLSYFSGFLSSFKINDGTTTITVEMEDEYESLHRLDFSVGVKF